MADVVGLYRRFGVRLPNLGDGWASTRCFTGAHQDRHPSARVHLTSGGFRCFACGAKGGVLEALDALGVRDRHEARRLAVDYGILDPPRRKPTAQPSSRPTERSTEEPSREPTPVAADGRVNYDAISAGNSVVHDRAWIYVDEHGAPVGRVRRHDLSDGTKRIWQERPHEDGWLSGLEGAHLPLYQLPIVLAAARQHRQILIVEGEKAVDALTRVGLLATTNAGGAGKWRPEHTHALHGATAVVVCDCDPPGRLHALEVTQRLLDAGIPALTPYDPAPLRRDGHDIVDQLAEVADTTRSVTPDIDDAALRLSLRSHLDKLLGRQLPVDAESLQRWHEHGDYLTNPAGRAHLHCPRCQAERVHRVSHGIAFCRCGHHQPAPA